MATSPIATKYVIHLKPSLDLVGVNAQVNSGESTRGTLSAIGNDGSSTLLTFIDGSLPATIAIVELQTAGEPNIPVGANLVATGTIFISGTLILVAATRGP